MPAPTSINELLDLARRSGVVDQQRMEAHIEKLRVAGQLPPEPAKLAAALVQEGILTNFQSEQLVQGKWRRFTIGKYKVLERLGSGGMGSVFLCEHKFMRRRVAVKVLPTAKAADPSSLERFYREARAVAAVDHPNIVHAYDIDQDETLHFLVMEYVNGPSLQEIVRRGGPVSVERACHYISQAARGLEHANNAGLVHRDIKPGNVLVDSTGVVKILDMGLARFFNDEEDMLTRKFDENVLGTADYLAPEQADDSHTVDVRADIYSLGGTFYFLLTGKTPFGEGTIPQKLMWQRTRQPKPLSTYRGDVPAEVQAIIDKMMAKEPADRYQLPGEVQAALAPWTQNQIPPPPQIEMPQLSPAITGTSPATGDPGSDKAKRNWLVSDEAATIRTPGAEAAKMVIPQTIKLTNNAGGTAKKTASIPTPLGQARSQQYGTAQGTAVPRPGQKNASATIDENSPWAAAGADTGKATAMNDTPAQLPSLPQSLGKPVTATLGRIAKLPPTLLWGAIALAVFGFTALIGFAIFGPWGLGGARQALTVGKNGSFASVRAALNKARPGDRIVLLDNEHRESLVCDSGEVLNIEIRAADGVDVVWTMTASAGAEDALMRLSRAEGFVIKGIRFTGEGRLHNLLVLTGHSPGLRLENVTLDGFTKSGIVVANCTGTAARPVQLLGVKTTTSGMMADSAIVFDIQAGAAQNNEHIEVRNCLLEGNFNQGPVWFKKERSSTVVVQQ